MRLALVAVLCAQAACSAEPPCTGDLPKTRYTCVALDPYLDRCGSSRDETLAREFTSCSASAASLRVGECGELESVVFPNPMVGDLYTCFFGADGGGLVGMVRDGDRGVEVAGRVATCTLHPPPMCP